MNKHEERNQVIDMERRRRDLLLVIATAIVFAFLLSLLAGIITASISSTVSWVWWLVAAGVALAAAGCTYAIWRLLRPPDLIRETAHAVILYNVAEGEILQFPALYRPQGLARQSVDVLLQKEEERRKELKENLAARSYRQIERAKQGGYSYEEDKHIFTRLFEFLLIQWLREEWHATTYRIKDVPQQELALEEFPDSLRTNMFVELFSRIEPRDIVEHALAQLTLQLPSGLTMTYTSPRIWPDRLPDPDSGELKLRGKYCDFSVGFHCSAWTSIRSATLGPSPSILGVSINPFFQEYIRDNLGNLVEVSFFVTFEAKFNSLRLVMCRKARVFAQLAEEIRQNFLHYFDIGTYAKEVQERRYREAPDKIDEILAKLDDSR